MTTRTARDARRRGRSPLRTLAAMAATAMAVAGLVGIGVAAPASADTAPVCPADTAETTWVLEGNVCVGTTVETAAPVQGASTWACPEGFSTTDDPVTGSSVCTKPVSPVTTYYCPAGYEEGPGFPGDDSCVKYKTVPTYSYQDATVTGYTCKSHKTYFAEPVPGCYELTWRENKWIWQITGVNPTPTYGCPEGWQLIDDDRCRMQTGTEQVVDKDRDPTSSMSCPEAQLSPSRHDDDDDEGPVTCPDETAPPVETQSWSCPEGFSSDDNPVTGESTCSRETKESTTATCPVEGDVLTEVAEGQWQCITPETPVTPTTPTTGQPRTFTATGSSSGAQDICLADGVTTVVVNYVVTGDGSGPTQPDADYAANVATVAAVNAAIAAQTPEGATVGACGAPGAAEPVVTVSVPAAATVAEEPVAVAVPQAATIPTAVPAGDGSAQPSTPAWALALAALGLIGLAGTGLQWARSRQQ